VVLAAVLGPRTDWFAPGAVEQLISAQWIVRPDSDRVGVRLHGPALTRRRVEELPSEPTIPGAVQVPPDGRPIVFGPDAPVTGGYPLIAVLTERALDLAAQLRPGDPVRLAYVRTGLRSP
jgi:allophanate hydrolase subunit 2